MNGLKWLFIVIAGLAIGVALSLPVAAMPESSTEIEPSSNLILPDSPGAETRANRLSLPPSYSDESPAVTDQSEPAADGASEFEPDAAVGEGWYRQLPEQTGWVTVTMQDTAFVPDVITVTVGSVVEWRNMGATYHTTTSDNTPPLWNSGAMPPGYRYAVRFLTPGTYPYHCSLHPATMRGRVVVSGTAPPPLPTGTPPAPEGEITFSDWGNVVPGAQTSSDIYTIQADGSSRTNVTMSNDSWDAQPSWSPDRSRIAFTRRAGGGTAWAIHLLDRSSGGVTAITAGPEDYEPAWSPDGSRIAFTRIQRGTVPQTNATSSIVVMAPDGSGAHPILELSSPNYTIGNPAWAPDMSRIVFTLAAGGPTLGQPGEIYSMNADGTDARILFRHSGWDDIDPAWSPSGRYIAFSSGIWAGSTTVTSHDIWLYDTQTGRAGSVAAHSSWDLRGPTWSPDGRKLAFSGEVAQGQWRLYILDLGTSSVSGPLTSGTEPDWAGEPGVPGTPPAPTPTTLPGTPTVPPFPTFPPGTAPPPPPFPTIPPPEPTATGPAPTFPPPTLEPPTETPSEPPGTEPTPTSGTIMPSPTATDGPSPTATRTGGEFRIFAPITYNRAPVASLFVVSRQRGATGGG